MYDGKFIDKPQAEQHRYVQEQFVCKEGEGWFTAEGEYAGATVEDVVLALIDLEDAAINSIGDCMSGFCVTPPTLTDFVRKP